MKSRAKSRRFRMYKRKRTKKMSSWLQTHTEIPKSTTLYVKHNSGFFSCCSVRLDRIIHYFNRYKRLPLVVDSSQSYAWYKPKNMDPKEDVTPVYFNTTTDTIKYMRRINYEHNYQYLNFKTINFRALTPFIKKYFDPSEEIQRHVHDIEKKYGLDDYGNICVLFFRGNDKVTETPVAPYSDYIVRAKRILLENPSIRFLVQSDEQEFIDTMLSEFPGSIYFKDETRRISKSITTVDKTNSDNFLFSKYFLAITYIMSKAKYIIFGSGNCSIWILLYRGNATGVQQFLKTGWV